MAQGKPVSAYRLAMPRLPANDVECSKTPAGQSLASASCSAEVGLTPEQIKNWRNVLCGMVGPYALIMPDTEVQEFRDKLQSEISGQNDEVSHQSD